MTLHELRHTFASIMLYEWRVPIEIVAEMMGHESPAITMRLYAHFVPGSQEAAIKALRRLHFHETGLGYVSCSPFRVPGARLAAAQAALKERSTMGQPV